MLAVHTPSGTKYSTISNSDGLFSMLNMKISGPYKVTATFIGYQSQEITAIFLELGRTSALRFVLKTQVKVKVKLK